MAVRDQTIDWREIVYRGIETQQLDYKAAQDWNEIPRAGKAKFARHAMAMANTRGGYVVVGVGEDENGNPTQYTGLTERQLRSFDPSTVGQTINRYADPSIDFDIVRPEVDGRFYAIFVIRNFANIPHVCSDSCGDELQQGVFYIRTPDARSRAAYRASEIHGLVQRALRNQRQVLGRMLRGVLYEGKQFAEPDAEVEFQKQLGESQLEARSALGPRVLKEHALLELSAYPSDYLEERFTLSQLRRAAENVIVPQLADFPFLSDPVSHAYFTNRSLLCRPAPSADATASRPFFWQLFQSGLFHHCSMLSVPADGKVIRYPSLVSQIGAAIVVAGQLYMELGCEDELLTFTFTVTNSEDSLLLEVDGNGGAHCYIPEIVVRKRRTVADLVSGPVEHGVKVVNEVCERFNVSSHQHSELRQSLMRVLGLPARRNTPV